MGERGVLGWACPPEKTTLFCPDSRGAVTGVPSPWRRSSACRLEAQPATGRLGPRRRHTRPRPELGSSGPFVGPNVAAHEGRGAWSLQTSMAGRASNAAKSMIILEFADIDGGTSVECCEVHDSPGVCRHRWRGGRRVLQSPGRPWSQHNPHPPANAPRPAPHATSPGPSQRRMPRASALSAPPRWIRRGSLPHLSPPRTPGASAGPALPGR